MSDPRKRVATDPLAEKAPQAIADMVAAMRTTTSAVQEQEYISDLQDALMQFNGAVRDALRVMQLYHDRVVRLPGGAVAVYNSPMGRRYQAAQEIVVLLNNEVSAQIGAIGERRSHMLALAADEKRKQLGTELQLPLSNITLAPNLLAAPKPTPTPSRPPPTPLPASSTPTEARQMPPPKSKPGRKPGQTSTPATETVCPPTTSANSALSATATSVIDRHNQQRRSVRGPSPVPTPAPAPAAVKRPWPASAPSTPAVVDKLTPAPAVTARRQFEFD